MPRVAAKNHWGLCPPLLQRALFTRLPCHDEHTCPTTCGSPGSASRSLTLTQKLKSNLGNGTCMLNILRDPCKLKTGLQRCVMQEETVTKCLHMDLMMFSLFYVNVTCFSIRLQTIKKQGSIMQMLSGNQKRKTPFINADSHM